MAVPAVPSQAFGDVQRYLRQKKATGQTVSPREERLAWQAYWDSMASNYNVSRQLGLQEEAQQSDEDYRNQLLDLREEELQNAEDAAQISGITQLAGTGATAYIGLKGTKLGASLGLGPAAATTVPAAPAGLSATTVPTVVSAKSAIPTSAGMAPLVAGGIPAAPTGLSATTVPMTVSATSAVPTSAGLPALPTAGGAASSASPGLAAASGPAAGTLGVAAGGAAAAGLAGSYLGGKVAGEKGSVTGGVGAGFAAGAAIGGPIGGVIGGVVGGLTSVIGGGKEGGGSLTPEQAREKHSKIRENEQRRQMFIEANPGGLR